MLYPVIVLEKQIQTKRLGMSLQKWVYCHYKAMLKCLLLRTICLVVIPGSYFVLHPCKIFLYRRLVISLNIMFATLSNTGKWNPYIKVRYFLLIISADVLSELHYYFP